MFLIKYIIVLVFTVITANTVYSQKKKCNYYSSNLAFFLMGNFPKGFSNDTTLYLCVDSNIVKSLTTVYTDSIRVDVSSKNDDYIFASNNTVFQISGSSSYKIHYPIPLLDNPPFKKAIYHDDCGLLSYINPTFYSQKKDGKKGYCILSADGKYINYAFLEEKDSDLYTKYNPLTEDSSGTIMTIKWKKMRELLTQELKKNKNKVVSVIKDGKVYIVKSFNH